MARALMIEEGDVIVGARGLVTDVCVATDAVIGAFVSLDIYLVRPNRAVVDPEYLAAFLELPGTQGLLAGGKQGSSLTRLPKDVLEKIEIPLPPKRSQQLIGQLAHSCSEEGRLLKRLAHLRSSLNAEVVARAFRATNSRRHSKGRQL